MTSCINEEKPTLIEIKKFSKTCCPYFINSKYPQTDYTSSSNFLISMFNKLENA